MSKKTHVLLCGKCGEGEIHYNVTSKGDEVTASAKKCTKCGYQYMIKELFDAKLSHLRDI